MSVRREIYSEHEQLVAVRVLIDAPEIVGNHFQGLREHFLTFVDHLSAFQSFVLNGETL